VFNAPPDGVGSSRRLSPEDLAAIRGQLHDLGLNLTAGESADTELARIRSLYEPYAISLAKHLRLTLPPWIKREAAKDNWQTTAWQQRKAHRHSRSASVPLSDEHT